MVWEKENIDEFVKDLDWLGRDLDRLVYIDCKPFNFWPNPDNGKFQNLAIPVLDFYADNTQRDNDLNMLMTLLEEIKGEKN